MTINLHLEHTEDRMWRFNTNVSIYLCQRQILFVSYTNIENQGQINVCTLSSCQLNSSKGLQKYHFYSDSPSQNITVLTEKSGKGWRAMAQIFQWVDVILDLLVGASEEELSEHDPEDQDD